MSSIKYAWLTHCCGQDEYPVECNACGTNVPLFPFIQGIVTNKTTVALLCNLCASTAAGNAHQYPAQYLGQAAILNTINFGNNEILKHAEAFDNEPSFDLDDEQMKLLDDPLTCKELWLELTGESP